MKVGDLVEIALAGITGRGVVIETDRDLIHKGVKVKFFTTSLSGPMWFSSKNLRVISAA